jgi:hypothetical protein
MKELREYREGLIERLAAAAREFRSACEAFDDPFAGMDGGWSVHQVASHTRDVDRMVYGARVRRTLEEENPRFPNFDAEAWMADHYDRQEPLADVLNEFTASVTDLCKILRTAPREAWPRESSHESMGGGLTLQWWVERSLAHIEEHLRSLKGSAIS